MIPTDNLILDMDGVLWRGEQPMPGLPDFFATLRRLNIGFVLATNNATKVASQYTEKLGRMGVTVPTEAILTSAEATAEHLQEQYAPGTTAYVIGESGLRTTMRQKGFELLEADDFVGAGARTELVVVGFTRHVCYPQLASAAHLINNGARFVGTNPDVTFPAEAGFMPGAGSILAFLRAATGQEPTVIGKPERAIFMEALERLDSTPENTAMVGDRLETDIIGAQAAGLHTILLLSGVTRRAHLDTSDVQPDLVLDNIQALTRYLNHRHESTALVAGERTDGNR
ncbi:MAG TPA: HAD-IIA family hydrolase [Candidatus Sulfomarinibacteraceae bacterium]|nr:HAD-IIA family hydrolase [Candidatus Sulfomarinibacteraceae bacterium]